MLATATVASAGMLASVLIETMILSPGANSATAAGTSLIIVQSTMLAAFVLVVPLALHALPAPDIAMIVLLVLASFVPAIAEVFNSLPQAVLGGCTIMMFGNIILSGFQMIAEAGFTQRNITIAALSLTIGIGFTQVSDIFTQFPALFQQIFASNCIAVAFVVAVILNTVLPSEEHFLSAPKEAPAADAE